MINRLADLSFVAGFTPMRSDIRGNGMSGMTRYRHLHGLIPRLGLFAGNENKLPYDFDEMISLIAPRPVLIVQPGRDRDADPEAVRRAVTLAKKAYKLEDASNRVQLQEPDDYGRLTKATQDAVIQWMKNNF